MTRREALAWLAGAGAAAPAGVAQARETATARRIDQALGGGGSLEYLLLDARGAVVAESWPELAVPFPAASLVKPFTALAYAFAHGYRYPEFECRGCWLKRGHGRIGILEALAQSCNSYFEQAAEGLDPGVVWQRYGLLAPAPLSARALAGEGGLWRTPPLDLARAYLEISRRRGEPGVGEVVAGLRRAAQAGTAAAVGRAVGAALAKTGTAPCTHAQPAPGDGLTMALYPAGEPRYALLVRKHGSPGFITAETAGRILAKLERPD